MRCCIIENAAELSLGSTPAKIRPVCEPRATVCPAGNVLHRRARAMMAYCVSEGRVFSLKASEWLMLLGGATLCGVVMLVF
jgi:hypothetical protein